MPARLIASLCLIVCTATADAAGNGNVTGIPEDLASLELYASPDDLTPADILKATELMFPLPILDVSDNGMFRLQVKGTDYWVISDDVLTDRSRAVEGSCEPNMAGKLVAHGKRGVGEGC